MSAEEDPVLLNEISRLQTIFITPTLKLIREIPSFCQVQVPNIFEIITRIDGYFEILRERLTSNGISTPLFSACQQIEDNTPFAIDCLIQEFWLTRLFKRHEYNGRNGSKYILQYLIQTKSIYSSECICCGDMSTYTDLYLVSPTRISSWTQEFRNQIYYDRPILSPLFPKQFCQRCIISLRSNRIPRRARCNGFRSVSVPPIVRQLNPIEAQLVSPYIPFFNIVRDDRITQFKMHGAIVAIPLDPQRTFLSQLPRVQVTSHLFQIQIIQESTTQQTRQPFLRASIYIPRLLLALEHLLRSAQYRQHGITFNPNFLEEYNTLQFDGTEIIIDHTRRLPPFMRFSPEGLHDPQAYSTILAPWDWDCSLFLPFRRLRAQNIETLSFGTSRREPLYTPLTNRAYPIEFLFPTCFGGELRLPIILQRTLIKEIYLSEMYRADFQHQFCLKILWDYLDYIKQRLSSTKNSILQQVGDTIQPSQLHRLQKSLLGSVRASPEFWLQQRGDLMSLLGDLKIPCFFVTLSPNEKEWVDMLRALWFSNCKRLCHTLTNPTDQELLNLEDLMKKDLIANNPVVAVEMVFRKFKHIFNLICHKNGFMLGTVADYYYRVEFQMRGSPHFHILLWIQNAPVFQSSNFNLTEFITFIDTHISCSYIDQNPTIQNQLQCQIHNHTWTCWKENKCRFHFPIPPSPSTCILEHIPVSTLPLEEAQAIKLDYNLIITTLQNVHTGNPIPFQQFLNQTTLSQQRYYKALQVYYIHQTSILHQRLPGEKMINKYNPKLFQLWLGNMDISFVLNPSACAKYIVSYMTKSFRELSLTLKEYIRDLNYNNRSPNSILSSIMTKLITASQVGIQEAICYIGYKKKLAVKSRKVISIYTPRLSTVSGLRRLNTLLPPSNQINEENIENEVAINDEDRSSTQTRGNFQNYLLRSTSIESICLFRYYQLYYYSSSGRASATRLPQINGHGFSVRRRFDEKRAVIKWFPFNPTAFPREYLYQQIYLFASFRTIPTFEDDTNLLHLHDSLRNEIEHNLIECEVNNNQFLVELQNSLHQATNRELSLSNNPSTDTDSPYVASPELLYQRANYQRRIGHNKFLQTMLSMNQEQIQLIYDVIYRLQHQINIPFYIFIEGSGGSGKSHLISALHYYCSCLLPNLIQSPNADEIVVLKVAPTGVAAVNIEGATIHSAFHIPITNSEPNFYANNLRRHREHLLSVKLLIIDEISAVSDILFSDIDNILRELHDPVKPFGGISVIIIGDLYQLPPVRAAMICEPRSTCPDLWQLFTRYPLTLNMRQREDPTFFNVLQELRVGALSDQSHQYLQQRLLSLQQLQEIRNLPPNLSNTNEIAYTNQLVTEINRDFLQQQNITNTSHFLAQDNINGVPSATQEAIQQQLPHLLYSNTRNLLYDLPLIVDYNYVVTYNIKVHDGIANGIEVKLIYIDRNPQLDSDIACTLWVTPLQNQVIGVQTRLETQNIPRQVLQHPQAFPITPIQQQFYYETSLITRTQFPLLPAYATTTYKCQSRSMQRVIAHVQYTTQQNNNTTRQSRTITSDHLYVACSRCRRGTDLFLFPQLPRIQQSDRQRQLTQILERIPRYHFHLPQLQQSNSNYTISFHNGQGCANKLNHYSNDTTFYLNLDILCLMELHSPLNYRYITSFSTCLELPGLERNGTGMAIFFKNHVVYDQLISQRFSNGNASIEILAILLDHTFLAFIYCNPHTSPRFLRQTIDTIMNSIQTQQITTLYYFGDFNRSCNQENKNYFQYRYGLLSQTTTIPTHRSGSNIDQALSTIPTQLHVYPSYWSDHSALWCSLPRN